MLSNPVGSVHEEATRRIETKEEEEEEEEEGTKETSKETELALTPTAAYGTALGGDEISLDSDDLAENLASIDQSSSDQDQAIQLLSLQCSLVVLAHATPGTLVLTKSTLTFTAEDSSEEYKKASYLVRVEHLNMCFHSNDLLIML